MDPNTPGICPDTQEAFDKAKGETQNRIIVDMPKHRIVTFDEVCRIPTPPKTGSYTPIPFQEFVETLFKHADRLMQPKGYELAAQQYVVNDKDTRLFFVLEFDCQGSNGIKLAVAGRTSHDKSMSASFCFGARVTICVNLLLYGSEQIVRKHTGNARESLNQAIILNMYEATDAWTDIQGFRTNMQGIELEELDGYGIMGILKATSALEKSAARRLLVSDKEFANVAAAWKEPTYEYEGGPNTLWALYNTFTQVYKDLGPDQQLPRHTALHSHFNHLLKNAPSRIQGRYWQQKAEELAEKLDKANQTEEDRAADRAQEILTDLKNGGQDVERIREEAAAEERGRIEATMGGTIEQAIDPWDHPPGGRQ